MVTKANKQGAKSYKSKSFTPSFISVKLYIF